MTANERELLEALATMVVQHVPHDGGAYDSCCRNSDLEVFEILIKYGAAEWGKFGHGRRKFIRLLPLPKETT